MKARKKGTTEWKEYKEVFDQYGVFQGLETAGYNETAEEECKRLGIPINPDDEFQASRLRNTPPHYISRVLPLECFDLWTRDDDAAQKLVESFSKDEGKLMYYNPWDDFRKATAKDVLCAMVSYSGGDVNIERCIELADELIARLKDK